MTGADWLMFFKWLQPAIPMLLEAMGKGEPVETVFAVDRAVADTAFRRARERRASRAEARRLALSEPKVDPKVED